MKLLFYVMICLVLIGCAEKTEHGTNYPIEEVCIKGVTYYNAYHRLAPAFSTDSKIIPCNK